MGAGVEPRIAAPHRNHIELAELQIPPVHVRDLELATGRRSQPPGNVQDLVVVKVEASHGKSRLGLGRLLLDADRVARAVELHNAVPLRVANWICKDRRAAVLPGSSLQDAGEVVAMEDIVAKHQRRSIIAHEPAPDDEGLSQPFRARLYRILEAHPPGRPVTEQSLELR